MSLHAFAETPQAKPAYAISAASLGPVGGEIQAAAFVAALNEGGWCRASVAPAGRQWNKRPDAVPPAEWVSVVLAGFGEQAEAFAFIADQPGGALRLAGHISYRKSWTQAGLVWIPPVSRLAAAFRAACEGGQASARRSPMSVRVAEWSDAEQVSISLSDMTIVENKAVPSVTFGQAFQPLEAMLGAALCAQGMTLDPDAKENLNLDVRLDFRCSDFRLARRTGGGTVTSKVKSKIAEDAYYGTLVRMAETLLVPDCPFSDFVRLGEGPLRVLGATSNRVYVADERGLAAYEPLEGKRLWPETFGKERPAYVARGMEDGRPRIFSWGRGLGKIDLSTGLATGGKPVGPKTAWGFAFAGDDLAVIANSLVLSAYRSTTAVWQKPGSWDINAGPLVANENVYAGETSGDLVCRNLVDGVEKWRKKFEGSWWGEIIQVENVLFGFLKGPDNLAAVKATDGTLLWQQRVGDVLVQPPVPSGPNLLVAAKNNRLFLLKRADGKITAEVGWPMWLLDVAVIGSKKTAIACLDLSGNLAFLDPVGLNAGRTVALPAKAQGPVQHVGQFPGCWASEVAVGGQDDGRKLSGNRAISAVLVGDAEGYLYIIPVD